MLTIYKIAVNIPKGNFSHVILHKVDLLTREVVQELVKPKIGKELRDQINNYFIVNGYYGEYVILRAEHVGSHPVGEYLTEK